MVLVLDLDETLVRVRCQGVHRTVLKKADFHVSVNLAQPPKQKIFECAVAVRPGLDKFFDWIKERRAAGVLEGPWIFTTASTKYTKEILKEIDPGGRVFGMRVLTRQACSAANLPGFLLKDLNVVPPRKDAEVSRKLLVDNNPISHVLFPGNSVLLRDWLGDNPEDSALTDVMATLDRVISDPDGSGTGNYAEALGRAVPGHGVFQARLKGLAERLDAPLPEDLASLRTLLKSVSSECQDIKRELLGAAP